MKIDIGFAKVAELADALDLGSSGRPWGFESPLSHQNFLSGIFGTVKQ